MIQIPETDRELARQRARWFACEWFMETPQRLHIRSVDAGGAPNFHPEFEATLEDALAEQRSSPRAEFDSPKRRVKRAFRRLRARAPREFDAAYCMVVIDEVGRTVRRGDDEALRRQFDASLRATTIRLNARAARLRAAGRDAPALTESDVLVLIVSALHKLTLWAG